MASVIKDITDDPSVELESLSESDQGEEATSETEEEPQAAPEAPKEDQVPLTEEEEVSSNVHSTNFNSPTQPPFSLLPLSLTSFPPFFSPRPPKKHPSSLQKLLEKAEDLKKQGNDFYAASDNNAAAAKYSQALDTAPLSPLTATHRAVYLSNRAAVHLKTGKNEEAIVDCSEALELDPGYVKALWRRSTAYEAIDDLERAYGDAQAVLKVDSENAAAKLAVKRLEPIVMLRREKLKDEMMGKLKDLGNMVLGKFGMSVDNFKAEQDPDTGSYSIKFQQ